jgi:hypothetical protein
MSAAQFPVMLPSVTVAVALMATFSPFLSMISNSAM